MDLARVSAIRLEKVSSLLVLLCFIWEVEPQPAWGRAGVALGLLLV